MMAKVTLLLAATTLLNAITVEGRPQPLAESDLQTSVSAIRKVIARQDSNTSPNAPSSSSHSNSTNKNPSFQGNSYAGQCSLPNTLPNLSNCPKKTLYSCENTTAIPESGKCFTPTPGGLVLITGFWSTYTGLEDQGQLLPANSWTIHGLWPDFCDGTYTQYCDLSRQYDPQPSPNTTNALPNGTVVPVGVPSVARFLRKFGRYDLLSYINKFWINQGYPNDFFWSHEFSKHATCFSTFDKSCYPNYEEGQDVVDFVSSVVRAHANVPTFDVLAAHGITPSNSTTYSLEQLQGAFLAQYNAIPYFGCNKDSSGKRTILAEVWVNAHVSGTPQFGQYKYINATGSVSSCVNTTGAITYPLRSTGSEVSRYNL